jgi:hypothetical protein
MKRAGGSTPLPRPLTIPDVMTLKTLADVRKLISHVPKERRAPTTFARRKHPYRGSITKLS